MQGMNIMLSGIRVCLLMLIVLLMTPWKVLAFDIDTHKTVGGMDVYIGVIPAEVIQGRGLSKEARMHGGTQQGRNQYHLVVALFDAKNGVRISNAQITANIARLGLGGSTKILERMKVNDAVTFGNYFALHGNASYRIRLKLDVPGKVVTEVLFEIRSTER
ncbi:hypothetical protein DJ030_07055 [bacterium endosymbiont of Escarpia laminata]|nr:MAG: hypothetical protein DJ030_07055 [bacterium endosymbiont of Escarpia laminata]